MQKHPTLPATRITQENEADLKHILAVKKFKQADYIRMAIVERIFKDKVELGLLGLDRGATNDKPSPA